MKTLLTFALSLLVASASFAQETVPPAADAPASPALSLETPVPTVEPVAPDLAIAPEPPVAPETPSPAQTTEKTQEDILAEAQQQIGALAENVDRSPEAREISAGLLSPIYSLAEIMESQWFYWVAFALMMTGVVSYALQLVLGKLVVLTKRGFSLTEILADLVSLAISLIGLVLTTQAATQNSSFTQSATSVLSAAVVGLVLGIILYGWGQAQEVAATRGRKASGK